MTEITTQTKHCYKCNTGKTIDNFARSKRDKDGLQQKCKSCDKKYRDDNKIKLLEYNRQYYSSNKEKILISQKTYYENNKELICEKNKQYVKNNIEIVRARRKISFSKYFKLNRDKCLAKAKDRYYKNKDKESERKKLYHQTKKGKIARINSKHKRRLMEKSGDVTNEQLLALIKNARNCYWCNCNLEDVKIHIDHYVPLSKGGEHTLNNLVISCDACNMKKGAKDPIKFAQSVGRLF